MTFYDFREIRKQVEAIDQKEPLEQEQNLQKTPKEGKAAPQPDFPFYHSSVESCLSGVYDRPQVKRHVLRENPK